MDPMYISITASQVTPEEGAKVEGFLAEFLLKLKSVPGVVAIYHYVRPEKGDENTIIIWKDKESLMAYRQGELVKEANAFETRLGLKSTREAYPIVKAL